MRTWAIHITGIVQGVGFRPFVYREAAARGLTGWVRNAGDGVHIEAQGPQDALDAFTQALRDNAPAAARVESVAAREVSGLSRPVAAGTFTIVASDSDGARTTLVSPDIATCPDCLRELFDPADRRYHYPFINCTNCGPRYTIIRALPYDRAQTSMARFPLCPACAAEYANPLDRRFHAQPNACFACGPHLTWRERDMDLAVVGTDLAASDGIIDRCAALVAEGGVVAIKGLGGFHLACNAADERAVAELRRRKRRSNKPLAIMVRDLSTAARFCLIDEVEAALLTGTVRPIVLLRRRETGATRRGAHACEGGRDRTAALAPGVAGDLPELGIMLPYTPLQHLLLAACEAHGVSALVMTSGNVSEEPIETDDALAWRHLVEGGLADALLGNDRAILARFDDSVARVIGGTLRLVRRARGFAPRPLPLPAVGASAPAAVLACGPEQKATLALTREHADGSAECLASQHIGDLENAETFDAWHATRSHMEALFDLHPAALACDRHPAYLSSQWAHREAEERGLPLVEVQHHHAHIASVMAEAASRGELDPVARVVGLALDGTGAGDDGSVWGGEVLVASLTGYRRAAHLRSWRLPGGAAAVRDARRCAYALLAAHNLLEHPGAEALLATFASDERVLIHTMVERGLNSPLTSSMGRFLDALAALLGICEHATYEGEPAIELEAAAQRAARGAAQTVTLPHAVWAPMSVETPPDVAGTPPATPYDAAETPFIIDFGPMLAAVLDALADGADRDALALAIHHAVARSMADAATRVARRERLTAVALSGGCFMNRLLLTEIARRLSAAGLIVLAPHDIPVNDGCIAYGQAAVARALLAGQR